MGNLFRRIVFKLLKEITPYGAARKVRFGVLKGLKWEYSSGYSQYWMGTYEEVISKEFVKYASRSRVVYDLGANIGYYTLIASRLTGKEGIVHAFEPLPSNLAQLKKHIQLNEISNIRIHPVAVSDRTGKTRLTNSDNRVANSICKDSPMFLSGDSIEVSTVKLDDLLHEGEIEPPQLMKIDVEGAEYDVLNGSLLLLKEFHPVIFLSTHNCHNPGVHKRCCALLDNLGYKLRYFKFHEMKTSMDDPWYDIIAE